MYEPVPNQVFVLLLWKVFPAVSRYPPPPVCQLWGGCQMFFSHVPGPPPWRATGSLQVNTGNTFNCAPLVSQFCNVALKRPWLHLIWVSEAHWGLTGAFLLPRCHHSTCCRPCVLLEPSLLLWGPRYRAAKLNAATSPVLQIFFFSCSYQTFLLSLQSCIWWYPENIISGSPALRVSPPPPKLFSSSLIFPFRIKRSFRSTGEQT